MRAFNIGQSVWFIKFGSGYIGSVYQIKELGIDFWEDKIIEITITENANGIFHLYRLSCGESKKEEDLFPTKNAAIQFAIDLLELEMDDE